MPATYEPIATTTLSSTAATIDFNSITSSYTDLRVVLVCTTTASAAILCRVNSDTGSNYSRTTLAGDGSSASSARYSNNTFFRIDINADSSTTVPMLIEVDFFSYAGSTNKTILNKVAADRNGSGSVQTAVQLWRSTSAITSISLIANSTTFASGTTATLYGIKSA